MVKISNRHSIIITLFRWYCQKLVGKQIQQEFHFILVHSKEQIAFIPNHFHPLKKQKKIVKYDNIYSSIHSFIVQMSTLPSAIFRYIHLHKNKFVFSHHPPPNILKFMIVYMQCTHVSPINFDSVCFCFKSLLCFVIFRVRFRKKKIWILMML